MAHQAKIIQDPGYPAGQLGESMVDKQEQKDGF